MPDALPDELVDLRHRAERLAAEVLVPLAAEGRPDPAAVAAASRQAGCFGLGVPVEHGGLGGSALALVVAREAIATHGVDHVRGVFGAGPGLLAGVAEPLRSRYLAPLLAGESQSGFAFTEPDAAPRPTWAVADGDELVINGQKSYVTGGGDADFLTVLVEVEGQGPAMVIVDTDRDGVELVRRFESLDRSHHAAFTFTDVRVPVGHVVGAAGEGMKRAMTQVTGVRMAIAATAVGLCRFVVGEVAAYLQAPHRSGQPLAAVERHRLRYGELRIRAYAARAAVYRTARVIDGGDPGINEAMAAKVIATEAVSDIADAAIQIVGGQALVEGHPLVEVYRRVRALRIAEGPTDVLALNVARGHLDLDAGRL